MSDSSSDFQEKVPRMENFSAVSEPTFQGEPKPIAEFIARPDFPQCSRGEFVDVGGFTGIVIDITAHSIRVRSQEKITQSFNIHVLRRLYGPRPHFEAPTAFPPPPTETETAPQAAELPTAAPEKQIITEPNFDRPPRSIKEFAGRGDFPKCAFGEYVDIAGFRGVVVEIVQQSLKVKSPQGITRSYGVSTLRSLYGRG